MKEYEEAIRSPASRLGERDSGRMKERISWQREIRIFSPLSTIFLPPQSDFILKKSHTKTSSFSAGHHHHHEYHREKDSVT